LPQTCSSKEKHKISPIYSCRGSGVVCYFKVGLVPIFFTYNEFCAIRKLIVSLIMHEFVVAFISTYNDLITWLWGKTMAIVTNEFKI